MKKILLFVIAISILSLAEESVTIAVLKLRPSGLQESEAEILTDYVRSILVETNLFQVVDRGKMNEILNEQEFQLSGCTSTECAVEVGKLLGVQKMLTGSVGKFGKLFTIELRMINIETGRIEKSSRYNYEGPIEQLLTEGIQNAIKKLVQVHKLEDEEEVIQEVVIEEEVIEEEIIEEEVIEEEIVPEEELIEEEIVLEEEEEVVEEPVEFKPGWTAKVYVNGGPIEPWGDPGTGAMFNMGKRAQAGAQLNIGNWVTLPVVLQPLTAEVMVGYGMWNIKEYLAGHYADATTNVISVLALGRYDVTDLILNLIGLEHPALGIFGVAGFQYNLQSWDFPNWTREFYAASSFGLNLGVGVKYNLMGVVGKPVEIDLRFTQGAFLMGDVIDKDGEPFYTDGSYYNHTENGLLIGIAYPF